MCKVLVVFLMFSSHDSCSDDVYFLMSVLNFKTAEDNAARRSAARTIYKAYLEQSHRKKVGLGKGIKLSIPFSSASMPAIFGGVKERRTNLEEEEMEEVCSQIHLQKLFHLFKVERSPITPSASLQTTSGNTRTKHFHHISLMSPKPRSWILSQFEFSPSSVIMKRKKKMMQWPKYERCAISRQKR